MKVLAQFTAREVSFGTADEGLLDSELSSEDPIAAWLDRYLTPAKNVGSTMKTEEKSMHSNIQFRRLIDGARQVIELPEEDAVSSEEGPLYLGWFALGHGVVLLALALHALRALSPMEQALVWGCAITVVGAMLTHLVLSRMRDGLALAEVVEVRTRGRKVR